jgi:hypothetical protein
MKRTGKVILCFYLLAGAVVAGCSSTSVALAPAAGRPAPNTATLPAPFAPLTFNILPIGPQITDGYDCPVGILTSKSELPDGVARANGRTRHGIFPITGGCDPSAGFPVVSPYPTPPTPSPVPLASASLATAAIATPFTSLALPSVEGWSGALAFPACASGTCDAGTTEGNIALNVLQSTSASSYTFALIFKNSAPEAMFSPNPTASEHPAPHIWLLYGLPPKPGASPSPMPTYLSGAPITLGFPSLTVTVPPGGGIVPSRLVLYLQQILNPPTYEIAIDNVDSAGTFLPIPLESIATYAPYTANTTTAKFALPSTPFAFQTDFTEYDFTLSAGSFTFSSRAGTGNAERSPAASSTSPRR